MSRRNQSTIARCSNCSLTCLIYPRQSSEDGKLKTKPLKTQLKERELTVTHSHTPLLSKDPAIPKELTMLSSNSAQTEPEIHQTEQTVAENPKAYLLLNHSEPLCERIHASLQLLIHHHHLLHGITLERKCQSLLKVFNHLLVSRLLVQPLGCVMCDKLRRFFQSLLVRCARYCSLVERRWRPSPSRRGALKLVRHCNGVTWLWRTAAAPNWNKRSGRNKEP